MRDVASSCPLPLLLNARVSNKSHFSAIDPCHQTILAYLLPAAAFWSHW
jgi:hypothetical protein